MILHIIGRQPGAIDRVLGDHVGKEPPDIAAPRLDI
jgi:hypothetical protein